MSTEPSSHAALMKRCDEIRQSFDELNQRLDILEKRLAKIERKEQVLSEQKEIEKQRQAKILSDYSGCHVA